MAGRTKVDTSTITSILENNQIEDVRWLCSLSESELDMLIALKMLVLQRAKKIGHQSLAKEFDLGMLQRLGFTMMEHLKEQLKDTTVGAGSAEASKLLDGCNLSKLDVNDSFSSMSSEELWVHVCPDSRKRIVETFCKDTAPRKQGRAAKEWSSPRR